MEVAKLKDKIAKLEAMASMTGPEAVNAKRAIERLIKKYKITPDQLSKPKELRTIKVHRLKRYALSLATFMRVQIYTVRGKPDYVKVNLDEDEYVMFYELLDEIKHIFNKKEREYLAQARQKFLERLIVDKNNPGELDIDWVCSAHKKSILKIKNDMLKSFMKGYMDTNYPFDKLLCQRCWEARLVLYGSGWVCPKCQARFDTAKYRSFGKHQDSFMEGVNTTTKSIKRSTERIGYNGVQ